MQEIGLGRIIRLPSRDVQGVLANLEIKFIAAEAGDGECHAIMVVANRLDVVRRVTIVDIGHTRRILKEPSHAVETNGGTIKRGRSHMSS